MSLSYDEIVDSPFEVGTHELVEFVAQDRPHRMALWGRVQIERPRLIEDTTRIIDAAAALFGGVPYPHYTFIVLSAPKQYGGLEHARRRCTRQRGCSSCCRRSQTICGRWTSPTSTSQARGGGTQSRRLTTTRVTFSPAI